MQIEKPSNIGVLEDFRLEFLQFWNGLPNKGLFFGLLAAWLVLFNILGNSTLGFIKTPSLLGWMYYAYQPGVNTDDGQGNIIPFVVLGLIWWKRKTLLSLSLKSWSPGLIILFFGLFFHLIGYAVQQPRISIVGFFIGLYGLTGLAWGPNWLRHSFFPFFLFIFCVPLGTLGLAVTFPLRLIVCRLVELVCHFVLMTDVIRDGTGLRDPSGQYQYEVAAACSGIRSLAAILVMAVAYGFVVFRSHWKRLLMIVAAVPLAVLGNVLRMLCIVFAADTWGQETGNYVHEGGPLGVLSLTPYVPAIIFLFRMGHWLREKKPEAALDLEAQTA